MADVELGDGGDGGDRPDRIEGEAVAGMALEADGLGMGGGMAQAAQLALALGVLGLAVGAGVQLDDVGADLAGGVELGWVGLYEQRDADAGGAQLLTKPTR